MPAHFVDIAPTLAAAGDAPLREGRRIDGLNLLPFLAANAPPRPRRVLFWRSGGYEAIRDGDWKLQVSRHPERVWLFNLASDPTESANLTARLPAEVNRLRAELQMHDREMAKPLWPALLEEPIRIDVPADAPW